MTDTDTDTDTETIPVTFDVPGAHDAHDAVDGFVQRRNDKRERKQSARVLPPGITQSMMKKYVVYYREMTYNKDGKPQPREYFKVESHPRLNKPWTSSKSTKISLIEKLNDANQIVTDLEENKDGNDFSATTTAATATTTAATATTPTEIVERWSKQLPKYTSLRIVRDTDTSTILSAIYDRKDNVNGFRWTSSHTISVPLTAPVEKYNTLISFAIHKLREKLRDKYALDLLL